MPALLPSLRSATRPLSRTLATAAAAVPSSTTPSAEAGPSALPLTQWTPYTQRCGVIAKKRGMTALWDSNGKRTPVTVLQLDDLQVISHTPPTPAQLSSHAPFSRLPPLHALQLGATNKPAKNTTAQMLGHFQKAGVKPKAVVREFRVTEDAVLGVGDRLSVAHFVPGQYVDVTARSIGKGFAGVMKRHGFHGLKASHGVSLTHRSAGSTGQHQDPGRVLPGKKMAGHLGTTLRTTSNLQVLRIDPTLSVIYVKGCVPGSDDADVLVRDAKRKVAWRAGNAVRKGREVGEWLGGGVRGLPVPGVRRGEERRLGLGQGAVGLEEGRRE